MRAKTIHLSFASMVILLIYLPGSQALPKWLQPKHVDDGSGFAPKGYSVYEPPPVSYGGYQYGGNGPLPTIQYPSTLRVSSTSLSSGFTVAAPSLPTTVILSGTSNIILLTNGAVTGTQALPTDSSRTTASESIASDPDTYTLPSSLYDVGSTATKPTTSGILTGVIELPATSSSSENNSGGSLTEYGSSEAGKSTALIQHESTTISETVSAIDILTSIPGTSISSGHEPVTSSSSSTITTDGLSQGYESNSIPTTTPTHLNCNHNNCLREFIRSSTTLAGFCATYTTTINTATTDLPVSMCHDSPVEISSACSCISSGSLPLSTPLAASTSAASLASSELGKTSGSSHKSSSALGTSGTVSSSIPSGGSSTVIGKSASLSSTLPPSVSSQIATSLGSQSTAMGSPATGSRPGITTVITSTVVIITSSISSSGSAGIPQSSPSSSGPYTNTTTLYPTKSLLIPNTTIYESTAGGAVSSALGTMTSSALISTWSHSSLSRFSPTSHRTFSYANTSAASRPKETSTLSLSTFSIGTLFPYSSGLLKPPFYTTRNSSTGWFLTATGFVTSKAFGGLSTSSAFVSPTYTFNNASSTAGPTAGSYPITSVVTLSMSPSISGVIISCNETSSAPYAVLNWTLCTAPTRIGSISISSTVGPLNTGNVLSSSISRGIPASSTAASPFFPTLNSNSSSGQTAISTLLPSSSIGRSWSSILTSKLPLTYSLGPWSSGGLPSTTVSGSIVASTTTSSVIYLVSNSTLSAGSAGTGNQLSSTYSNDGVLTPISLTFSPLPSNSTSLGGPIGTGYLSSSSSSTRNSGSNKTSSSIYGLSSSFSPSSTGSFPSSTSLNGGTLTSTSVPSPTILTSTASITSPSTNSGSSSTSQASLDSYSLPSSLISSLLPFTWTAGVTNPASSPIGSTTSEIRSTAINSASSASSSFISSTLSVSYYDPGQSSTSKAAVPTPPPYYIPPPPPPGYYPRRLATIQRK